MHIYKRRMPSGHCVTWHLFFISGMTCELFFSASSLFRLCDPANLGTFLFSKFHMDSSFTHFSFFITTFPSFFPVSQSSLNLPLILIIGIPASPVSLHALHIVQCTTKCLAVDTDFSLAALDFLVSNPAPFLRPTCFPFSFAVTSPSRVRWCRSATSDCSNAS